MLVTPIGTILFIQDATTNLWFYQTSGTYQSSWQPNICSSCFPATVSVGGTYTVSGTQFNGLTQGAFYGDDYQSATNYPLVRITNDQTQHVFYARTHGFSTMGVATGDGGPMGCSTWLSWAMVVKVCADAAIALAMQRANAIHARLTFLIVPPFPARSAGVKETAWIFPPLELCGVMN